MATPNILDPNFYRTVVLVCEHDAERGALGLVLNRPVEAEVSEYVPQWAPYASSPPVVHLGGPVAREVALSLAVFSESTPEGFDPIVHGIGLFDLGRNPIDVPATRWLRVYSGYAGWSFDQLEAEIDRGDWFVCDSSMVDVFGTDSAGVWREVLLRQKGHIRLFASYPDEVSDN